MTRNQQERQTALEVSDKHWRTLVEHTPDLILRTDTRFRITYCSKPDENTLGIGSNDMRKPLLSVLNLSNPLLQSFEKKLEEVLAKRQFSDFYFEEKNNFFFATIVPEFSGDHLDSILFVIRDITDLRQCEREIEKKSRHLESINKYMDNFVHAVAHDLRSPIASLKLLLEISRTEPKDENHFEMVLEKGTRMIDRLEYTLNSLVEIIEAQTNIDNLTKEVSFEETLQKVLQELGIDPHAEKINIETQFNIAAIRSVYGYISSIFRNMISNAIKYRRKGVPLQITIRTLKKDGFIRIAFKDNGIGMTDEVVKNQLFKPFKRFSSQADGKGLGLFIVKTMIEKNGGNIEVQSTPGKGTEFRLNMKEYQKNVTIKHQSYEQSTFNR